ncbi:MAG: UDP-N-acetylmuramate dehydrogenase [Ruminococcaceae bacterium]|nr:UDP-N-acetylmuramate dehydrogenase [Oscillospiraceae bacterium]
MNYTRAAKRLAELTIEYREQEPMSEHTSFRIGGPAKLAVFPRSKDEAVKALSVFHDEDANILILGNGTNVLMPDAGFDGAAVILTGMKSCGVRDGLLIADAGASVTRVAAEAAKHGLAGLEFAYGIPGTVGGGVYMNAGAYGGEMAQVVAESSWYDPETGETGVFIGDANGFAYRNSAYMGTKKIILSASFRLMPGERSEIEARMEDYLCRRREKQPLEFPSAGSTFKRGNGFITAQIIDEAGLKGRRVGGAQVSEKHAGFIINRGGATAEDVLALVKIIKTEVYEKFGKTIECEIRCIGT